MPGVIPISSPFLRVGVVASTTLAILLLLAHDVAAQDTVPPSSLQGLLSELAGKVNSIATGVPSPPPRTSGLAAQIGLELSTAPFGTSTGGLAVSFDPATGLATAAAPTFGPIFSQRSLTLGKGRISAGFNLLHASYNSFGALNISNGDLRFVKNARTPDGLPFAVSYTATTIEMTSETRVGFVSYGVTDALDVGLAVPFVTVTLSADVGLFTVEDVDITPGAHLLVLPTTTSSGLGDIALLGKYHFWRHHGGGLAAALEVRLPTGDTTNFRGAGVWRTQLSAIWSRGGRVSPHANVGFEYWSAPVQNDEVVQPFGDQQPTAVRNQISYAFGLELQPHARLTVIADVVGRRLLGSGRLGYRQVPVGPGTAELLVALPESLDAVSFAPGFKWNLAGNVLLTGTVLTAITNGGLRANLIPVVGLDWAFGRQD